MANVLSRKLISVSETDDHDHNTINISYLVQLDGVSGFDARSNIAAIDPPLNGSGGSPFYLASMGSNYKKENQLWVEVQATYLTPPWDAMVPTDRTSIISGSYEETTQDYFLDKSTPPQPCVNSAHERFESFPQRRAGNLMLQIVKNIATYPAAMYDTLKFTRNQSDVTIRGTTYPALTLLFLPVQVQETVEVVVDTKYRYFVTTFRLAVDAVHFHEDVLEDRGYMYLDSDGKQQPIVLDDGKPLTTPYPLDGSGGKLSGPDGTPATLDFLPYDTVDWGIDFG